MQNIIRIVLLFLITLLCAACTDLDGFITITHQSDSTDEDVVNVVEKDGNVELDELDDEEDMVVDSPTDLEGVLKQMKKASQSITSALMTGTTTTEVITHGASSTEKSEIESKIYVDPFIQYVSMATTSPDGDYSSESYMTEEAMYVFSSDGGGWIMIKNAFADGETLSVFQDSHFDHLLTVKDYFTLSEEDKHYLITYSGPDESYQEIVGGSLIQMDAFGAVGEFLSEIMEDIELTGTLEFTVSKETFLIIEHKSVTTTTISLIDMKTIDDNHYKYSGFNTLDSFEVPDEIKNNAMKFPF